MLSCSFLLGLVLSLLLSVLGVRLLPLIFRFLNVLLLVYCQLCKGWICGGLGEEYQVVMLGF